MTNGLEEVAADIVLKYVSNSSRVSSLDEFVGAVQGILESSDETEDHDYQLKLETENCSQYIIHNFLGYICHLNSQ